MYKNIYLTFKRFTNSPFIKALSSKAPFVFFSYHLIAPLPESDGDNEPLPCRHETQAHKLSAAPACIKYDCLRDKTHIYAHWSFADPERTFFS